MTGGDVRSKDVRREKKEKAGGGKTRGCEKQDRGVQPLGCWLGQPVAYGVACIAGSGHHRDHRGRAGAGHARDERLPRPTRHSGVERQHKGTWWWQEACGRHVVVALSARSVGLWSLDVPLLFLTSFLGSKTAGSMQHSFYRHSVAQEQQLAQAGLGFFSFRRLVWPDEADPPAQLRQVLWRSLHCSGGCAHPYRSTHRLVAAGLAHALLSFAVEVLAQPCCGPRVQSWSAPPGRFPHAAWLACQASLWASRMVSLPRVWRAHPRLRRV